MKVNPAPDYWVGKLSTPVGALNDTEIYQELGNELEIDPFDRSQLQPVSYDLTLSPDFRRPKPNIHTVDLRELTEDRREYGVVTPEDGYTTGHTIYPSGLMLHPHDFILGSTQEEIFLSPQMMARVEGKSSLGRLGLAVHITAGFVDPGFRGQITLEIVNLAPYSIVLYPGMAIAQIVFSRVNPPVRDYSATGHYQGQRGPTESRYRFKG